jgi:lactobin A/cerein 7B family class IIb bacteriocin
MIELTEVEIAEVSGGIIPQLLIAIAVYDAVTDFAKGYAEGVEASKR